MKKMIALLMALNATGLAFSQTYFDATVKRACECVDSIPLEPGGEQLAGRVGICLISSIDKADAENFKKDFDIDIGDILKSSQKIGGIMGKKMIAYCPVQWIKLNGAISNNTISLIGSVAKIEIDGFVAFTLVEKNGKQSKIYWINNLTGNDTLPSIYQDLSGKEVEIKYESRDLFDPKIGEYRKFKVLTYIKQS
jgi:hypothetical protein